MAIRLFQPIEMRGLTLPNRIIVPPMTQFSAHEGVAGDWHLMHLGQFAVSGAALVLTESTYVEPHARNAPSSLSIYSDEQGRAIGRIVRFFNEQGMARFGVQLCHGGRKASNKPHWEGGGPLRIEEGGYQAVAPSPVPIKEGWPVPRPLSIADIQSVVGMFEAAARRADEAGVDIVELHGAHGYLIHQFLSPVTNHRDDGYGGSLKNRMRFALEVFEAVRAAWPDDKPLGIRISASDWIEGGWTLHESIELAQALDALGCDYIHVSSGGLAAEQVIETGPGYQTEFAAAIKERVRMKVVTVGQITTPHQAETILRTGQADMVALARAMLFNPRWPWTAAIELGAEPAFPRQYERADPRKRSNSGVSSPGNQTARTS